MSADLSRRLMFPSSHCRHSETWHNHLRTIQLPDVGCALWTAKSIINLFLYLNPSNWHQWAATWCAACHSVTSTWTEAVHMSVFDRSRCSWVATMTVVPPFGVRMLSTWKHLSRLKATKMSYMRREPAQNAAWPVGSVFKENSLRHMSAGLVTVTFCGHPVLWAMTFNTMKSH